MKTRLLRTNNTSSTNKASVVTQSDMTEASQFNSSLLASPKQSLSKICGYRPHKVSQIESLPQTWVIKPKMLARS